MRSSARKRDVGFTLVELLIVIVILGILATVTVFAVRGITDQGQESACATEFKQLQTAQDAHFVLVGSYGSEADLVTNGALTEESTLFDTSVASGEYTITPNGSTCTESGGSAGGGGGGGVTPTAAIAGTMPNAPQSITFHGISGAEQYTRNTSNNAEILIFGRSEAALDWATATDVRMDVGRRVTFLDIDDVATHARLRNAIIQANNNPPTSYAIYRDDDTTAFQAFADFEAALTDVLQDPAFAGPVHALDADAVENMAWLFLQYP